MNEIKTKWLDELSKFHGLELEDIQEVIDICVSETAENIKFLKNYQPNSDSKNAIRVAHSIKGATANIQQKQLSLIAEKIETQLRTENFQNFKENINELEIHYNQFLTMYKS